MEVTGSSADETEVTVCISDPELNKALSNYLVGRNPLNTMEVKPRGVLPVLVDGKSCVGDVIAVAHHEPGWHVLIDVAVNRSTIYVAAKLRDEVWKYGFVIMGATRDDAGHAWECFQAESFIDES